MRSYTMIRSALIGLVGAAVALPLVAEPVCRDFPVRQRITKLGGPRAVSKKPLADVDALRALYAGQKDQIAALLGSRDLGGLSDGFFAALEGDLETRSLLPGDEIDWMAWRGKEGLISDGPICMATKKDHPSWLVRVEETTKTTTADPRCELRLPAEACHDEDLTLDASASSAGVRVTSGGQELIGSGSTSWTGRMNPGTYQLQIEASSREMRTVVDHEFLVPRVCGNLAYLGAGAERQVEGAEQSCTETKTFVVDDCTPRCSLTVSPAEIERGESVTVEVSGMGAFSVDVMRGKKKVTTLDRFPATLTLDDGGTYTFAGTASRGGQSVPCDATATVKVKGGDWILRAFGGPLSTEEDRVMAGDSNPGDGFDEVSAFGTEDGSAFGLSLERLLTDRIGIEGTVMIGAFDGVQKLDIDGDWEMADENFDFKALTIGANFHLTPDARVDFYVGPFVGFADLDDARFSLLGRTLDRELDAEGALLGAQIGLDIPFGDGKWGANVAARKMWLEANLEGNGVEPDSDLTIDPLLLSAGLRVRF